MKIKQEVGRVSGVCGCVRWRVGRREGYGGEKAVRGRVGGGGSVRCAGV